MSNTHRTYYRDSNCFKEKVVQEVSTGKSISEVCRCYGIKGTNTVQRWLSQFGRDKFFSLLRRNDLLVERKRSYTKTTCSRHHFHQYGNLIKDVPVVRPDQVWASDITYLRTEKKFVYLSLITDMYSRRIVGWSLSDSLSPSKAVRQP